MIFVCLGYFFFFLFFFIDISFLLLLHLLLAFLFCSLLDLFFDQEGVLDDILTDPVLLDLDFLFLGFFLDRALLADEGGIDVA